MKKSFKRTIACILAVLMIVCSLPFTASAQTVKWEGETLNDKDILNPNTDDMWYQGDTTSMDDVIGMGIFESHIQKNIPKFAVIVSDIGNSAMGEFTSVRNAKDTEYAGSAKKLAYEEATILNPADLKAGQRIAITVELTGLDLFYVGQLKVYYDPDCIIPGGYASATAYRTTKSEKGPITNSNVDARCNLGAADDFYSTFDSGLLINTETNEIMWGCASALGTDPQYMGKITDEYFGTYGLCFGTVSFEVQKDCDLSEVLTINKSPYYSYIDIFDEDIYDNEGYASQLSPFPKFMSPTRKDTEPVIDKFGEQYFEIIWDNYSKQTAPTTVDYKYTKADGTSEVVTVNAGETPTAPANTAAVTQHIADTKTHSVTTYSWPEFSADVTEYKEVPNVVTADCSYEVDHVKVPTYTETGLDRYTCSACGHSYDVILDKVVCTHNWGDWNVIKASTCKEQGTEQRVCSLCGATEDRPIALAEHTWGDWHVTKASNCKVQGTEQRECSVCGKTEDRPLPLAEHTWDADKITTPANCVDEGVKTFTCTVCSETKTEPVAIDKDNHKGPTEVVGAKEATCTETGYTGDTKCTACGEIIAKGEVIDKLPPHTPGTPVKENEVAATYETEGSYDLVTYCTVCNEVINREHKTIPVLEGGVAITVKASTLGTATVAGKDVTTSDVTAIVAPMSDVVLTAKAVDGAKFVGWSANGKMVSTDASITVKALSVVTYQPIFEATSDKFTVVFTDKYGNVLDTQSVAAGTDIVEPAAPTIAGYTFAGWSMTADEIDALAAAATITAVYEKTEVMYTITAEDGATVNGEATISVPYDTAVTATAKDAKAWKIGDAIVAYGDTYTFYVGADMTITPVFDLATAQVPTVTAVSATEVTASNGLKAGSFLATRTMTPDCTYVNAGFIYGLNVADSNIELGDVDGRAVKAKYCSTTAEQFALTYGVTAQAGTITARAFLAYVDAQGTTQVVYAQPQTYTYK